MAKFEQPDIIYTPFLYRTDLRFSTQDSYTPFRVNFQLKDDLVATSTIKFTDFTSLNDKIDTLTGYGYRCYFYELSSLAPSFYELYSVLKERNAAVPNQACSFASTTLTVTVPSGPIGSTATTYTLANANKYQLVVLREPTDAYIYRNYRHLCERGGFSNFDDTTIRKLTIATHVSNAGTPVKIKKNKQYN